MAQVAPRKKHRLAFLDWTRGFAALIMLQGHVFHSFTRTDLRNDGPYTFSQFCGGLTPAVFLFLTGVTLGFLMDSSMKKGLNAWQRTWAAMRRSGYLLMIAFLFRLQMWSFSLGKSPWTDIFKVDILNCMGLGIIVLAPLAIFAPRDRVRFAAVSGLAIASASPLISGLNLTWIHPFLRHWFEPSPMFFAFFPWAAFIAFGLSFGTIIRLTEEADLQRVMQWATLGGLTLVFSARYVANLPYSIYSNSDFWLNSPAIVLIKLGVILVLTSFAFLWTRYMNPNGWSFVRQLGVTSLLVYWVHTEIVYGAWLGPWKEQLNVPQTVAIASAIILLMIGLSVARTGWKGGPNLVTLVQRQWTTWREPVNQPAAGD